MKNITLAVDEDVLKVVRRYAAERETTVNALVRDHLRSIAERTRRSRDTRRRLLELIDRSTGDMGEQGWDRAKLHER
jgi:hypothetical protein